MKKVIIAVNDKDWRNCPECKSDAVQAAENGYQVDGISTDLMFCYDCKAFYVVYPDWYFKGRGKAKKIAEFPKTIEIEIEDFRMKYVDKEVEEYKATRATFARL